MASDRSSTRAHQSFPLTRHVLHRLSLTPEFDYHDQFNARHMNARLGASLPSFTPAEYASIGLIGMIFLYLIEIYQTGTIPALFIDLDNFLLAHVGKFDADESLSGSLQLYPTGVNFYAPESINRYLFESADDPLLRHSLYKSIILLITAETNTAIRKYNGVFTDSNYIKSSSYQLLKKSFEDFFVKQPTFGKKGISLLDLLATPSRIHPDDLTAQLNYIRLNWADFLGQDFLDDLLRTLDYLQEESHPTFSGPGPTGDPLGHWRASYWQDLEPIRYSPDQDWMPNLILLAKNVFVWMDQLSRKYQRPIYQLDQIPEEELALLSSWGITGLWLIGLWERSSASQKIKRICGNPDAVPSAYSLYDYSIAAVLGGDAAYQELTARSKAHNIRLAADMVPNHMGIYSRWVIEHPQWFLSLTHCPFPSYYFSGPNLSEDSRVKIYLDDHYYNQTDAAVVFKRVDAHTGNELYIYHGNDGTSMPWNDTAQLDFLNPATREAIIETILQVARKFPIIRFDAAMTLTKKHYQRLWYPEPGSGGAIPTRSEYGLNKTDFDQAMPQEFWQEVVDRVGAEAPDTLLLAEAFWMMEGYFVRTLGMHRVYNSAFMHMLRDEDNQKYRDLIIKTLEFDPQILKRYVNFMNNPDEETAVAQFGSDGKYFGICLLMATLPGLPMFGHGQIEGYTEKYGMEYRRAYYQEELNQTLVDRHIREIFPLLKLRYLFAEVDNFFLFDLVSPSGSTNENVIAFSNRKGSECALILYHNKWGEAEGKIHYSTAINSSSLSLLDTLGLGSRKADFLLFRDHISGLEFIRSLEEISASGLFFHLGAYDYRALLDFQLVIDRDGSYQKLHQSLHGEGVADLQEKLAEFRYEKLLSIFEKITNGVFQNISNGLQDIPLPFVSGDTPGMSFSELLTQFGAELKKLFPDHASPISKKELSAAIAQLENVSYLSNAEFSPSSRHLFSLALAPVLTCFEDQISPETKDTLLELIARRYPLSDPDLALSFIQDVKLIQELVCLSHLISPDPKVLLDFWFSNELICRYLRVNRYQGVSWFNKEALENLLDLTVLIMLREQQITKHVDKKKAKSFINEIYQTRQTILNKLPSSKYQVDLLRSSLK